MYENRVDMTMNLLMTLLLADEKGLLYSVQWMSVSGGEAVFLV